ncbi:competence/damage-inducible protein A [Alteribacter natronophilus]|uniref:competence/damage-inducible protein A n=1 Tax=Alteribacter natronophilus TaxID=2583810 RepID=UPI00110D817F|nr:competence/damage-inducible protein A [Alteribacter natronophilus]TMW73274.1 competence/damage-inducible protein A [Alteribacter natronophilus]
MKAEIIAVGSELLLGQISNTNARFLSGKMTEVGVDVHFHTAVGDNRSRLTAALSAAEKRSDLIILTGGLGPTRDDLTKETVAEFTGTNLVMDSESLSRIESYFRKRDLPMTENNRKQAAVIEGADVFINYNGLACGMAVKGETVIVLLPGPPGELEPMVQRDLLPWLARMTGTGEAITSRVLRFFGIGEAQLAGEIDDIIANQSNPTVAPLASDGEVTIRLTSKGMPDQNVQALDRMEKTILSRAGTWFYGYDTNTLAKVTADALGKSGSTIACAESLTGGMFGSMLTGESGASSFYTGGVICYDANVKQNVLNVKEDTIRTYGTVSRECAAELAENVRTLMKSTIGISFTGVAGPDSLEGKEPGLVFIAIADSRGTAVKRLSLAGSRSAVRERAAKFGCYFLLKQLNEEESTKE